MASKRREPLNKRSKEIIRNTYQFCRQEEQEGIQISHKNWLHRTEHMTGVSRRTVQRIVNEHTKGEVDEPKKLEKQAKILVDDFDKCVIRRTIQNMYEDRKKLPTLSNIRELLKENIEFTASLSYLSKLLKELGFSYKRCSQNRKILMERPDVVSQRIRYLRKIKSYRDNGHPIVYTDETYVHSSHAASKCWQTKDVGLKVPFGKGSLKEIKVPKALK